MRGEWGAFRELDPYRAEPPAVPSGSRGKRGGLLLGFELDSRGRSTLRHWARQAPLIAQQALYFDRAMPEMPCVQILSSGGPQVDGDRFEVEFRVGPQAMAHITTGAATKVASMRHNFAATHQRVHLDEGAYLEYLPQPLIPCRHSRYIALTELEVAPSATLFWSEILLPGRIFHQGELFAYDLLSLTTTLQRVGREPLYREKMLLQPAKESLKRIGAISHYPIVANLLIATPHSKEIAALLSPFHRQELAFGLLPLPEGAGLSGRILGHHSNEVSHLLREVCSTVRKVVKGSPLPTPFPWAGGGLKAPF